VEWWVWLAFGLVLFVVELATPSGFFVMFFGLGALTLGLLTAFALVGPAWSQWLVFIGLSVAYLLLFRGRMRGVERPPANIDTLVGELAIPRERILPGQFGRVDLRGTVFNARNDASNNLEPGQRCRVTGVDAGLVVFVQPE
jgi:inner membrane protein